MNEEGKENLSPSEEGVLEERKQTGEAIFNERNGGILGEHERSQAEILKKLKQETMSHEESESENKRSSDEHEELPPQI